MLNGLAPIFFIQYSKKKVKTTTEPLAEEIKESDKINLPFIPIYLIEEITGLYIESEESHIDIQTNYEADENGKPPLVKQTILGSTVSINLIGSRNSIGLILLTAMADYVLPKVASEEYYITYLHGSVTIFKGLLNSFSVVQNSDNNLVRIKIDISKGREDKTKPKAEIKSVPGIAQEISLGGS